MALGSVPEIERRFEQSQNDLVLQTSDFSLQGLKEMVDSDIIDLMPKYQRRERWGVERQSELIESFLLNVPVPPIYLAEDLPRTLQNALKVRPYLRVITLLKQSHPRLKYEVFIRLNRGGIRLNNQEIRNVAFRGELNDAIYVAGENKLLRSALKIEGDKSAGYQQMQDAKFVGNYPLDDRNG